MPSCVESKPSGGPLKQFLLAIEYQSIQDQYDSIKYPASVDRIITSGSKERRKLILNYFIQQSDEKDISQIKLQHYVNFVRKVRDSIFPNDYKKKSRKFISHYPMKRSSTLEDFIDDMIKHGYI